MSSWHRVLDWFAGRPGRSDTDRLRASRTAAFCLVTLALAPVFGGMLGMAGFVYIGLATSLLLSAFAVPLAILRSGGSVARAGHLTCALGATASVFAAGSTTGPFGPSVLPLLLLPVAGTMLVGPRAGWAWLGVMGGLLGLLGVVGDLHGWVARAAEVSPPVRAVAAGGVLTAVGTIIQAAVASMVHLEGRRRAELDAALSDLERRVEERTFELRCEVDERRRAEDAAQRATRAKSAFLANMSHELRTPLNAILGYTEMVEEELADRPELRADLGHVASSARHLLRLIQDVLDLARVEQGRLELRLAEVDLGAIVASATEMVRLEVEARGNRLVLAAGHAAAWADADRVQQILLNLLSNANKFTEHGEIRVEVRAAGGAAEVRVADTGVGIRDEDRERIFERFAQADESPTRSAGGAGLGLTIAREVARRMQGDLTVQSVLGFGSTFTLRLPATAPGRDPVTVWSE